jgi:CDP-glucose 4,6-dehydratase
LNRTLPDGGFWHGRRVLLTGHSGFKGSWLSLWLTQLGAHVTGASLRPHTEPSLFQLARLEEFVESRWIDVRDAAGLSAVLADAQPEVVIHLAAQALVRHSYADPLTTFATNFTGTLNLLESVRHVSSVRAVVVATTDKVYRNNDEGRPFKESDPLGGHDPYSASKAAAEMVVESYRKSYYAPAGIGLAAARAGNVIGGGDWSDDRILPDAVRAWGSGNPLLVRNPKATRPWQHVLEPLAGYLRLAEFLFAAPEECEDFNFGPEPSDVHTVREVVEVAQSSFGRGEIRWSAQGDTLHEARALALDNSRAKEKLGCRPVWNMNEAVARTMTWYRRCLSGDDARDLCQEDLQAFSQAL